MQDITTPLRVAVGSHDAGSGKGCAMNVVSWINGDTTITDYPDCSDLLLTRLVQHVNDSLCGHTDDDDGELLCPDCSRVAIDLGLRTIGTGLPGDATPEQRDARRRVWVTLAVEAAERIDGPGGDPALISAREQVRRWLRGTPEVPATLGGAGATGGAVESARAAALGSPFAYAYAKNAIAHEGLDDAGLVSAVIDRFHELNGTRPAPVAPEAVASAAERMTATA